MSIFKVFKLNITKEFWMQLIQEIYINVFDNILYQSKSNSSSYSKS